MLESALYYFDVFPIARYALYGIAGLFGVLASTLPRILWRFVSLIALVACIGSSLFIFEMMEMRRFQTEMVLEQQSEYLERQSDAIGRTSIEAVRNDQSLYHLLSNVRKYDDELYKSYVNSFVYNYTPENKPYIAARRASHVIFNEWQEMAASAHDDTLNVISVHFREIFKQMRETDPRACTAFVGGQNVDWGETANRYRYAVAESFMINKTARNVTTRGDKEAALEYASSLMGQEKLTALLQRTASFDEVCTGLVDIYTGLADGLAPDEAASIMRYWVAPIQFQPSKN